MSAQFQSYEQAIAYQAAIQQAAARIASGVKRLVLHPAQQQIRREAKRFNVPACGRRIGKTELAVELLVETSVDSHKPAAYFAPTYKMLSATWDHLVEVLHPVTKDKSEQEKRIEIKGGGSVDCWSFEAPDACRGRKYKRVVIDEAAHSPGLKRAWEAAIRPTLTDLIGDAWFPSTPRGMNDFWQLYQKGLDPLETDWACWQMPTSANPFISPAEIESARRELPQSIFEQEYLAQFIEDGGAVFRNLLACAIAATQLTGHPNHHYIIGCDWAKVEDFSVFSVIDTTLGGHQCYLDRFNRVEYKQQIDRLLALCERFDPDVVMSEKTGNLALAEFLRGRTYYSRRAGRRQEIPLRDFTTTNASKAEAIQALSLAFEQQRISVLSDPVQLGELQAFTAERLPAGGIRYAAPEGLHDDTVMALAFAWYEARRWGADEYTTALERAQRYVDQGVPLEIAETNTYAAMSREMWIRKALVKEQQSHFYDVGEAFDTDGRDDFIPGGVLGGDPTFGEVIS